MTGRGSVGLRRLGLQAALFGLALAGLVPVALLFLTGAVEDRRDAGERVAEESRRVVRLAVRRHSELVDVARPVLQSALRSPFPPGSTGCDERLRELTAVVPYVIDIAVTNDRGAVQCRARRDAPSRLSVSEARWHRRAQAAGSRGTGDYEAESFTGGPALVMGAADHGSTGEPEATAFVAIDPAWLKDVVETAELPGAPRASIIAPDGIVVARHPGSRDWVGRLLSDRPRRVILARREGAAEIEGLDGVRRLYVFAPLGTPPAGYVAVAAPTEKAYAEADAALRRNLLLVGLLSLVGVAGARLAGKHLIVGPTQAVVDASRRLAAGDLSARVSGRRPPGELGEVSQAFDEMASALEGRELALEDAAAELRRSQAQLQAILDNAPAAIFVQDLDGRYLLVNDGFEELTGIRREAARGRTNRELLGAEAAEPLERHLTEVLETCGPIERQEVLPSPEGERTFHALRFPLLGPDGNPYALCGISQDITEQRRIEDERAALAEQMQRGQRLESLGLLAGGVAHDFNNLLSVILNYTEFALEELEREPNRAFDTVREDLGAVVHAARSAAGLTRQLLVFARRDRAEAILELMDVNALLAGLKPLLRRTLSEEVELELDLATSLDPVMADSVRLEQVVVNLAVNARDAMPRGGRLRLRTEAVTGTEGERVVRLTVTDTGTGMSPEVAARAFDPFFTTKPKGRGTGLGLATVYGIVTALGGSVSIDSRLGEGTSIVVDLPAAAPGGTVRVDEGQTEGGRGETVLVVEDEMPVRAVMERILARAGYAVLAAEGPAEALAELEREELQIDLLVTDVVMPGFSGPELVRRARLHRPSLRSLYVSGYSENELPADRGVSSDDVVLTKPFDAGELLGAVRESLARDAS